MAFIAAIRAIHIAATLLAAGVLAFELLVLRHALAVRGDEQLGLAARRFLRRCTVLAVAVGLLSWLAWLADLSVNMSGLPPAQALRWPTVHSVVAQTTFGRVWTLRAVLWIAAGALLVPRAGASVSRSPGALALVGGLLLASLAWTGHAVDSASLHLAVDAVHLCAAGLWLGMLPPLGWLAWHAARSGEPAWLDVLAEAARRFSPPAAIAVATLVLTGVLNAAWLLDAPSDLFTTAYGRLLTLKLVVFAGLLALAVANRALLTPRIAAAGTPSKRQRAGRLLHRTVLAEGLLALVLIGVVGFLGVAPPAAEEHMLHGTHAAAPGSAGEAYSRAGIRAHALGRRTAAARSPTRLE